MQIAVIDFARHVVGLGDANSREFAIESQNKVIDIMEGQIGYENTGGSMRLGAYECKIAEKSVLARAYGLPSVWERHRHRYEFNNAYRALFTELGLTICGESPDGTLVEAVELDDKRFHVGVQYHPEFKSRPHRPHPLFTEFIAQSLKNRADKKGE
nr:gamma-glutamyl-gamma-aminobutyrate hydrolase family protein [Clostridiales bacterium]